MSNPINTLKGDAFVQKLMDDIDGLASQPLQGVQPVRSGCLPNTFGGFAKGKFHNAATVSFPSVPNANPNNFTQVVATLRKGGSRVKGSSFIQYIDIECTKAELEDRLDDHYGNSSDWKLEEKQTKQGKCLLMYTDIAAKSKHGIDSDILAEYDKATSKVHFKAFKMSSRNFYTVLGEDMQEVLAGLAYGHQGTYIGQWDGDIEFIVKGDNKRCKLALVEENAKIPYTQDGELIEEDSTPIPGVGFTIKKPIKQFVQENPDVQAATKGLAFQDAMNKLGQILLQKRAAGEIEGDEFIDYFRQVGIVGVTDPSLQKIYALIKP